MVGRGGLVRLMKTYLLVFFWCLKDLEDLKASLRVLRGPRGPGKAEKEFEGFVALKTRVLRHQICTTFGPKVDYHYRPPAATACEHLALPGAVVDGGLHGSLHKSICLQKIKLRAFCGAYSIT